MKNLLKYLSLIIITATLVAGIHYLWNYRQHYGDWNKAIDMAKIQIQYDIKSIEGKQIKDVQAPVLPNIDAYTIAAIKEKAPTLAPGYLLIQNLEEGYRKMRNRSAYFGEKQDRLDPLSIVISSGVYDLETITKEVADETLIQSKGNGVYALYVPLSVRAEATLLIGDNETLLMSVNTGGLLSSFGDVFITNASIKGWNTEKNAPAEYNNPDDFRPHITIWCGGELYMAGSEIAHLGYQASKSYGISYTSCNDTLYRHDYAHLSGGTGWIIGNRFLDIYFGFYSYEAEDVVIIGNEYDENIVYAIDPHDRSKNLIIAHNTTRRAKQKHGIIISREVSDSFIFKNISEDNNGSGIMIDRSSERNVIAYNISQRNKQDGLTFYESPHNLSYKNILVNNGKSGMRIRNSWDITSYEDVINYNGLSAIQLYSLYLTPARGATYRDLDLDPYVQRAGASFIKTEMVGNKESNIKLEDFDAFTMINARLYQSPPSMFAGDVKGIDDDYNELLLDAQKGINIVSKSSSNQNLTRNSVVPR